MGNLHTFGCSYTWFRYPTYADYLAPYFDKHYNLGQPGGGNRGIFNKIVKHIIEDKIKYGDTVIIQWSSLIREDRIFNERWIAGGTITNSQYYDKEWIEKYYTPEQQTLELISYITTILPLLRSKTNNIKWFYMLEPWFSDFLGEPNTIPQELTQKLESLKRTNILKKLEEISLSDSDHIESIESYLINNNIRGGDIYVFDREKMAPIYDDHPSPHDHYIYSKYVIKSLNYDIFDNKVLDKKLFQNSIFWRKYITNSKTITEFELKEFEEKGNFINYESNDFNKWPCNNTLRNNYDFL